VRSPLTHLSEEYVVMRCEVFMELSNIRSRKYVSPDAIPYRILKDLAEELVALITAINNTSLRQSVVQALWEISIITVLLKVFPASEHKVCY
jgi:hypothetical protein